LILQMQGSSIRAQHKTVNIVDPEQLLDCASTGYTQQRATVCTTTWGIYISPLKQIKTFIPIYKNEAIKRVCGFRYLTIFSAKMYTLAGVRRFKFCVESIR